MCKSPTNNCGKDFLFYVFVWYNVKHNLKEDRF